MYSVNYILLSELSEDPSSSSSAVKKNGEVNVQCAFCSVTLCSVQFTVCSAVCSVKCEVRSLECEVRSLECSVQYECAVYSLQCVKGEQKKRGHMKLLLMQILKYFTEWIILFWKHKCIVEIYFTNWYKTHFLCMLKNYNKLFCKKKTFFVGEGALLNTLKLFFLQNKKWKQIFWCFTVWITFL